MQQEVEILQTLSQQEGIEGIVKLIEVFEDFTHIIMVMEYLNNDDLLKWFMRSERTEIDIKNIFRKILKTL